MTESIGAIFRAAECGPETPALPRDDRHHPLVATGVAHIVKETQALGGQLGPKRGARAKLYDRLSAYAAAQTGQLALDAPDLEQVKRAIDDIYQLPLRQAATDTVNRLLRTGATDATLARAVVGLRDDDQLSVPTDDAGERREPKIVCSLALVEPR